MRGQFRNSRAALVAAAAMLATAGAVRADTAATFVNFATDVSVNTAASFNASGPGSTGPLVLSPANPDVLYVLNRAASGTTNGSGGAYPFSLSTHTRLTNTAGNILLSSNVPGLTAWTGTADPYAGLVGADGSLYLVFNTSAGVFKVSNPLSDTPTATRILPNYNGTGDDDPAYLAQIPASFIANNPALSGYTTSDFLLLDSGIDADNVTAVTAVHADGSDGSSPLVLWKRPSAGAATSRGGVDAKNGYFYFIQTTPETNTINGTSYSTLYRMNSAGAIQSLGLKLPAGVSLSTLDDAIAVNPADGSVWITQITDTADASVPRAVFRVDTQYMTDAGSGQFVAPVTAEFTATHFNLGVNSLTFSPDGKTLYAGTPDGTDKVWAFTTLVHTPGDANGDGVLNADDFALLDRGFAGHLGGWTNGDFNVDGVVDAADYLILDTAYGQSHALSPDFLAQRQSEFGDAYVAQLVAAVPEPGSAAVALLAAVPAVAARRRGRESVRIS